MKSYSLILALGLLASCASTTVGGNLEINVGWMHGACLSINNSEINTPKKVTLVKLEEKHEVVTGTIVKKATSGNECFALMDDRKKINIASGHTFYVVESPSPVDLAIGYLDLPNKAELKFDFCTTTEGIKYSIHRKESEIWGAYYYLGYDSEPTCP